MGFLSKLLGLTIRCPECGTPGAKDGFAGVRCQRAGCRFHDATYAAAVQRATEGGWAGAAPVEFLQPITINYENFRGEAKTFVAEAGSIRVRGAHVSAAVQPTGRRIALKRDKIANLAEVDGVISTASRPTPREQRVIEFHSRRGTTSALYEELRRKYPDA